jgi:hypothetical protein
MWIDRISRYLVPLDIAPAEEGGRDRQTHPRRRRRSSEPRHSLAGQRGPIALRPSPAFVTGRERRRPPTGTTRRTSSSTRGGSSSGTSAAGIGSIRTLPAGLPGGGSPSPPGSTARLATDSPPRRNRWQAAGRAVIRPRRRRHPPEEPMTTLANPEKRLPQTPRPKARLGFNTRVSFSEHTGGPPADCATASNCSRRPRNWATNPAGPTSGTSTSTCRHRSRSSPPSGSTPAGSRSAAPSSRCATRTRSCLPRQPGPLTCSPKAGYSWPSAAALTSGTPSSAPSMPTPEPRGSGAWRRRRRTDDPHRHRAEGDRRPADRHRAEVDLGRLPHLPGGFWAR